MMDGGNKLSTSCKLQGEARESNGCVPGSTSSTLKDLKSEQPEKKEKIRWFYLLQCVLPKLRETRKISDRKALRPFAESVHEIKSCSSTSEKNEYGHRQPKLNRILSTGY